MRYECKHKIAKLGDNFCSICGVKFDKKFSAQDLVGKFKLLDTSLNQAMRNASGGETSASIYVPRGMSEALEIYKEWKQEHFGLNSKD